MKLTIKMKIILSAVLFGVLFVATTYAGDGVSTEISWALITDLNKSELLDQVAFKPFFW